MSNDHQQHPLRSSAPTPHAMRGQQRVVPQAVEQPAGPQAGVVRNAQQPRPRVVHYHPGALPGAHNVYAYRFAGGPTLFGSYHHTPINHVAARAPVANNQPDVTRAPHA